MLHSLFHTLTLLAGGDQEQLMQTLRVLMVDDNREFLEAAERFVATVPNVKVVGSAVSGREGLRQIMALNPELVLMDYVMPDMNGVQATRLIKDLPDAPLVVILTLHDIPEYHAQAKAAGADGFLAKVDFVTNFLPTINRLLKKLDGVRNPAESGEQAQVLEDTAG